MINKLFFVSLIGVVLSGCAGNPSPSSGSSAEEFASNLKGKEYNFLLGQVSLNLSVSGAKDDVYGLVGLKIAFEPFVAHCNQDGGTIYVGEKKNFAGQYLPIKLTCLKSTQPIWEVSPNYSNYYRFFAKVNSTYWYYVTLNPLYLSDDELSRNAEKELNKKRQAIEEYSNSQLVLETKYYQMVNLKKEVGDKVCTNNNFFGYVENINNEKMKVNIIGRVDSQSSYYFFKNEVVYSSFKYSKVPEPIVWANASEWAKCNFSVNI